jgi:catechol 2,3-dioxygenase-like lactoylglutathione lyase family enzyme
MKVERIDHIHILVRDLEGAMKLFSDVLGTKFIGPLDYNLRKRSPRRPLRVAFDTLGFEFISPTSKDHFLGAILEREGEGFLSIGLKVSDIDEAVAELEAKGIELEGRGDSPVLRWAITKPEKFCNVRLELVQYDGLIPAATTNLVNLGLMDKLPWFAGSNDKSSKSTKSKRQRNEKVGRTRK